MYCCPDVQRTVAEQGLSAQHALSLLQRRYPKLDIWLELLDRRVDLIGENFDIDIRVGEPIESNLIAHRIVRSSRVLCASPDYLAARGTPAALADLADHDCLPFRDRDHALGIWRLQGCLLYTSDAADE